LKKIVHLSDVHFGKADSVVVGELFEKVNEIAPDLLVVSGDLTQRARRKQFRDAREFLDSFSMPKIIVPGNHDVPLYNVFDRFARPFRNYDRSFGSDHEPWYFDGELAVAGVNTARSLTVKGGRINEDQVETLRERLGEIDDSALKIVVSHHPFDLPENFDDDDIVGRAKKFMPTIANCGADIFLAGHLHVSAITNSARRYHLGSGKAALVIQAGTATSTRERGEENSFNLLEYTRPILTLKRFVCPIPSEGFHLANDESFTQTEHGWSDL
jgi:3',5'-cyclic AMP phosphodiesterase CpdA